MDREKALVLAIDPGSEHVGFSIGQGWNPPIGHGVMEPEMFLMRMRTQHADRIVVERFDIRMFTADAVATLKLIGVIEWLAKNSGTPLALVNASDKKKFLDDVNNKLYITAHAGDAEAIRRYDLAYGTW